MTVLPAWPVAALLVAALLGAGCATGMKNRSDIGASSTRTLTYQLYRDGGWLYFATAGSPTGYRCEGSPPVPKALHVNLHQGLSQVTAQVGADWWIPADETRFDQARATVEATIPTTVNRIDGIAPGQVGSTEAGPPRREEIHANGVVNATLEAILGGLLDDALNPSPSGDEADRAKANAAARQRL